MNKRKQRATNEVAETYTLSRFEPAGEFDPFYVATVRGVQFAIGQFATIEEARAAADANLADYLTRLDPKQSYRVEEIDKFWEGTPLRHPPQWRRTMTKMEWLRSYGMIMPVEELVDWARRNNLDAAEQRRAQDHFLTCEECGLDIDNGEPSADPCEKYFTLVSFRQGNKSMAVWPDGRFAFASAPSSVSAGEEL